MPSWITLIAISIVGFIGVLLIRKWKPSEKPGEPSGILSFWRRSVSHALTVGWVVFGVVTTVAPDLLGCIHQAWPDADRLALIHWINLHPIRSHLIAAGIAILVYLFYAPYRLYRKIRREREELRNEVGSPHLYVEDTHVTIKNRVLLLEFAVKNIGKGHTQKVGVKLTCYTKDFRQSYIDDDSYSQEFAANHFITASFQVKINDLKDLPEYAIFEMSCEGVTRKNYYHWKDLPDKDGVFRGKHPHFALLSDVERDTLMKALEA